MLSLGFYACLRSSLMVLNGKAGTAAISQMVGPESSDDITAAAERLIADGVISLHADGELQLPEDDYSKVAHVYRTMFSHACPVRPLGCEWYDKHINRQLLAEIERVQRGLPLPERLIDTILSALRLSPTALRYALHPIAVIVNGREQMGDGPVHEVVAEMHEEYFLKVLFDSLQADFTHPALSDYFYGVRGIRELELKGEYLVKNETGICLQHAYCQRHVHGLIEALGGRPALMLALSTHPEPWEKPVPSVTQPPEPESDS
jgi:hypothetical protein